MKFIRSFFALLRKLVGLEEDIENIMKPINRIVRKLEAHEVKQLAAAEADEEAAIRAQARAAREREVAAEAARLRDKYAL